MHPGQDLSGGISRLHNVRTSVEIEIDKETPHCTWSCCECAIRVALAACARQYKYIHRPVNGKAT